MKRIGEEITQRIKTYCRKADVLEVGCGDGARLRGIAPAFKSWTGIDPDKENVEKANSGNTVAGARFQVGYGEELAWPDGSFDVVVFTLSLHHVPEDKISLAIGEAIRVTRLGGYILFLEPLPVGTFFEAEMRFGCCDGDERRKMAYAYYTMLSAGRLREIEEFIATVVTKYDSFADFKQNVATLAETEYDLEQYLLERDLMLNEKQRLNVFELQER